MRRILVLALFASLLMPQAPALATERPYSMSLIGDAYTGDGWTTGVRIELADGWKTYWRMPGEAGIPPQFTWTASQPAHIEVHYPVPSRFADASGETVGYKHEVIFPVTVQAGDATELKVDLDLFFAVCKDICIPADAKASITLGSAVHDPHGGDRVSEWMTMVPQAGAMVTAAAVDTGGARPVLKLTLAQPADDLFVEASSSAYFRMPVFSADSLEAGLVIDNVKDVDMLKGAILTITALSRGKGLEQQITLP